jgi:hypothetical protein
MRIIWFNLLLLVMSHSNARASDLVKCTDEKGKVIYSDHGCKARDKPASVRIVDSVYDSQSIRDAKARSDQAADSERSKEVEERNLQMVAQNTRNCDAATADYKKFSDSFKGTKKYISAQGMTISPEGVAVRRYCGEGALPVPKNESSVSPKKVLNIRGVVFNPVDGGYIMTTTGTFCVDSGATLICNGNVFPK